MEYAQTVWSPYKVKLIEEIEKVQKRATKILPWTKKPVLHSAFTEATTPDIGPQESKRRYD